MCVFLCLLIAAALLLFVVKSERYEEYNEELQEYSLNNEDYNMDYNYNDVSNQYQDSLNNAFFLISYFFSEKLKRLNKILYKQKKIKRSKKKKNNRLL